LFNHLSAISESIGAFGWIAVTPAPAPYIKEMSDAAQFYTNRVLKDYKEKYTFVEPYLLVLEKKFNSFHFKTKGCQSCQLGKTMVAILERTSSIR
jgi:hypothetical protein